MISIIIATKNGGKWLARSIASISFQTEKEVEVIIVSDGSTDNTAEIARTLSANNPNFKVIELTQNVGPGLARDKGIKEARGEYIAIIDDDDQWISAIKLKTQKEFLDVHPEYVLVGTSLVHEVNDAGALLSVFKLPFDDAGIRALLFRRNCFITSSVMFRKEAYEKAGGFPALYLAEEYDLWFRLGKQGKFANLDNCDIAYTIHPEGASKVRQLELYRTILKIIKNYKDDYPNYAAGYIKAQLRIMYALSFGKLLNITKIPFLRKIFRHVA